MIVSIFILTMIARIPSSFPQRDSCLCYPTAQRGGFTLVELAVVLTIIGIAAGIVAIRFSSPLRQARVHAAVERWKALDQLARQMSSQGKVVLKVRYSAQSTNVSIGPVDNPEFRRWSFASPLKVDCIDSNLERIQVIDYSPSVGTQDYRITVRDGNYGASIFFAGGTGAPRQERR